MQIFVNWEKKPVIMFDMLYSKYKDHGRILTFIFMKFLFLVSGIYYHEIDHEETGQWVKF